MTPSPLTRTSPTASLNWQRIARRARVPLGIALALGFLLLARPTLASLLAGLPLVALGLALRAYASGYLSKNKSLATSGPYAHTRNPLYLGSGMLAVGLAIAGARWEVGVLLVAMLFAVYLPTILSEERYLRGKFADFDAYCRSVPRFLPRLTPAGLGGEGAFSRALYVKHREYQASFGAGLIYAILVARLLLV